MATRSALSRPKRALPKVDYVDEKVAQPKRSRSSGWKELKGNAPYRATALAGISAEVTEPMGKRVVPPTRNANGDLVFKDFKDFRPNLTPEQVMRLGSFGGTYWRPITSAATGEDHKEEWKELPEAWFKKIPVGKLAAPWARYSPATNFYGVKCGGSLDMWESSGWIANTDPYGWFQWYCRFYAGRRSTDDARQISRWCKLGGPKGRFRNQLIGNCARKGTTFDDVTISPVIRQSLQHWGKLLMEPEAEAYVKLKKLPKLPKSAATAVNLVTVGLSE